MRFPLDICKVTRDFYFKSNIYIGGQHAACDFIDPTGTLGKPVYAVAEGLATPHPMDAQSGLWVSIDHPDGWRSQYRHLSLHSLTAPTQVTQGQTIGLAGSTGNSTGPHVHFDLWHKQKQSAEAFYKAGWYAHDPMLYLGKETHVGLTDDQNTALFQAATSSANADKELDTVLAQLADIKAFLETEVRKIVQDELKKTKLTQ